MGALEKQIESDLSVSDKEYSNMNSIFFTPNIIAPLFIGVVNMWIGKASKFLLYAAAFGALGHIVFAMGADGNVLWMMYLGKFLAGTVYETIDTVPVLFLGTLFKENWGLMVGVMNGVLRFGSVASFMFNPYLYQHYGIRAALWVAAVIGLMGVFFAFCAAYCDIRLTELFPEYYARNEPTDSKAPADPETAETETDHLNSPDSGHFDFALERKDSFASKYQAVGNVTLPTDSELMAQRQEEEPYTSTVPNKRSSPLMPSRRPRPPPIPEEASPRRNGACGWLVKKAQEPFAFVWDFLSLGSFSPLFYCYLVSCMFLFGAMVPFWFIGSKFFQVNYKFDIFQADALMLLPEGCMVIISPLFGYIMDTMKVTLPTKYVIFSLSCLFMSISYLLICVGYAVDQQGVVRLTHVIIPAVYPMTLLGIAYAIANSLSWDVLIYTVPDPDDLAAASGLMAASLNLLPAVLPHAIVYVSEHFAGPTEDDEEAEEEASRSRAGLVLLAFMGILAAIFAFICSLLGNPPLIKRNQRNDSDSTFQSLQEKSSELSKLNNNTSNGRSISKDKQGYQSTS